MASAEASGSGKQKRIFLFELADDEIKAKDKHVNFCSRIPAVNKGKNDDEDEELNMQRAAFMNTINMLWRNKDMCTRNATWLAGRLEQKSKQHNDSASFSKISTLKNLDDTFLANWVAKRIHVSISKLQACCSKDPDALVQIIVYLQQCSPGPRTNMPTPTFINSDPC